MSIRVFLCDDHAIVRDGLRAILDSAVGIEVVGEAENGREALRQIVTLRPDVAIMDIAMPELNGIDATAEIHQTCPEVRVLILSMCADREHVFEAFASGAAGYLLKRSAGREVTEAIRAVSSGARYVSPHIGDSVINDYLAWGRNAPPRSPLQSLSSRERQVLQLVAEGKSNTDIGGILHISPNTVHTHRSRIMKKLGVNGATCLIRFAVKHGLTPMD
jgi:DNA-binding NarL/FixJ family response regulator